MIEDFAASGAGITTLVAKHGIIVEAHSGDHPGGTGPAPKSSCEHGGTNAMAACLIGAGRYSYYHCTPGA